MLEVDSGATLAALTDSALAAHAFRLLVEGTVYRVPEVREGTPRILGHVIDMAGLAHVVVHHPYERNDAPQWLVSTVTLRRADSTWRVEVDGATQHFLALASRTDRAEVPVPMGLFAAGAPRYDTPSVAGGSVGSEAMPEAVVTTFLALQRDRAWDAIAGLLHPTARREIRSTLEAIAASKMSSRTLGPVLTAEALAGSDSALAANAYPLLRDEAWGEQGDVVDGRRTVIGVVYDGPDRAHVLARAERLWKDRSYAVISAVSVARAGGAWRVELDGQTRMYFASMLEGMQALKNRETR